GLVDRRFQSSLDVAALWAVRGASVSNARGVANVIAPLQGDGGNSTSASAVHRARLHESRHAAVAAHLRRHRPGRIICPSLLLRYLLDESGDTANGGCIR